MIGLALLAGGCASQQAGTQTAGIEDSVQSARVTPGASDSADARPDNDDAAQPWSPNYGWQPRTRGFAPSYAPIPVDRVAGTARYATMDPDAVIRHAVAAHEMRRQ